MSRTDKINSPSSLYQEYQTSKHLIFIETELVDVKRKTKIFQVRSKFDGTILGEIRWYSSWRQYVLMPYNGCVWSWDCLKDASLFIKDLMDRRKEVKADGNDELGIPSKTKVLGILPNKLWL